MNSCWLLTQVTMSAYSGWFWSSRQSTHWNQKKKPTASFNRHPSKSSNTSTRSATFAVQGIMPNSIFLLLLNSILNNNLCRSQCWGNVLRTADADSEVGFSRGAHYSLRDPCPKRHHSVFSEEIIQVVSHRGNARWPPSGYSRDDSSDRKKSVV